MAETNLTLDSLLVPAIPGYMPDFGSKVVLDPMNKGGLTTLEIHKNMSLPFMRHRPIPVTESGSTSVVEDGALLSLNATSTITLSLGNGAYVGVRVKLINSSQVYHAVSGDTVQSGETLELVWNGSAWVRPSALGEGIAPGIMIPYAGTIAPKGYLLCIGGEVLKAQYPALYAAIGIDWGTASDSAHFKIPDIRESTLVGAGQSDNDYNETTNPSGIHVHDVYALGEFKDDQFQSHTHKYTIYSQRKDVSWSSSSHIWVDTANANTGEPTGRIGTTTHGKQMGTNYIIKY